MPRLELDLVRRDDGSLQLLSKSDNVELYIQQSAIESAKRSGMYQAHLDTRAYLEAEANQQLDRLRYERRIEFYDGMWRAARLNHRDAWNLMREVAYGALSETEAKQYIPLGLTLTDVRMELLKPHRRSTMETLEEEQQALMRRLVEIDWEMEHLEPEPEQENAISSSDS